MEDRASVAGYHQPGAEIPRSRWRTAGHARHTKEKAAREGGLEILIDIDVFYCCGIGANITSS